MAKKANNLFKGSLNVKGRDIPKNLHVYLFDNEDNLLETIPVRDGKFSSKMKAEEVRGKTQILLGPEIPEGIGQNRIRPILIKKMGGYQPSVRINPNRDLVITDFPDFKFTPFQRCLVTGNLSKSFIIDGEDVVLPVCDARVHICEVDRIHWWWPYIPVSIIDKLAEKLKELINKPEIKFPPIPDPGPEIGPLPIDWELNDIDLPSHRLLREAITPIPDTIKSGILSANTATVHNTIFNNFHILHPYLCYWPLFWPYFYRCDEIGTVYSDCNGRFDLSFIDFTGDRDIYIWVEVFVDGQWVTVFKPPRPCGTRWNYVCGSEINIRIKDSRVKPCQCEGMPGAIVWMKRIGNGVKIRNIQQHVGSSGHLADAQGLTYYGSSGNRVSPFAENFPFVVQFGSGFPNSNVTHYRWKYRKLKDDFLTPVIAGPNDMEGIINKNYTYEVSGSGGTLFATGSFNLGPTYDAGRPKYKIPHVEASDDVPEPTAEWNQDTYSINTISTNLSHGLYQFTFELLDASGNLVPVPANTFVVDRISSDPSGPATIDADGLSENYLIKNGSGQAIGFRFKMRIDNQLCRADIKDAMVDGAYTDPVCGMGHYNNKATDTATLRFIADHPQEFATYSFGVIKGNSNPVLPGYSSGYIGNLSNGYVHPSPMEADLAFPLDHQHQKTLGVAQMLGACDMAAFAENLRVYATHTNGSRRIAEYDASDTAAIAIVTP